MCHACVCVYVCVCVCVCVCTESLLKRTLLYTAITRGKQLLFLLSSPSALDNATHKSYEALRNTLLAPRTQVELRQIAKEQVASEAGEESGTQVRYIHAHTRTHTHACTRHSSKYKCVRTSVHLAFPCDPVSYKLHRSGGPRITCASHVCTYVYVCVCVCVCVCAGCNDRHNPPLPHHRAPIPTRTPPGCDTTTDSPASHAYWTIAPTSSCTGHGATASCSCRSQPQAGTRTRSRSCIAASVATAGAAASGVGRACARADRPVATARGAGGAGDASCGDYADCSCGDTSTAAAAAV